MPLRDVLRLSSGVMWTVSRAWDLHPCPPKTSHARETVPMTPDDSPATSVKGVGYVSVRSLAGWPISIFDLGSNLDGSARGDPLFMNVDLHEYVGHEGWRPLRGRSLS